MMPTNLQLVGYEGSKISQPLPQRSGYRDEAPAALLLLLLLLQAGGDGGRGGGVVAEPAAMAKGTGCAALPIAAHGCCLRHVMQCSKGVARVVGLTGVERQAAACARGNRLFDPHLMQLMQLCHRLSPGHRLWIAPPPPPPGPM